MVLHLGKNNSHLAHLPAAHLALPQSILCISMLFLKDISEHPLPLYPQDGVQEYPHGSFCSGSCLPFLPHLCLLPASHAGTRLTERCAVIPKHHKLLPSLSLPTTPFPPILYLIHTCPQRLSSNAISSRRPSESILCDSHIKFTHDDHLFIHLSSLPDCGLCEDMTLSYFCFLYLSIYT